MNIHQEYNQEDFNIDVEWLKGYGIPEQEAKDFLNKMLLKQWVEQ